MIKYPLFHDQQLSDQLKIKRSTITAIKNKLLRLNFYSTYVVPNFELIGCGIMCVLNGEMPVDDIEKRKKTDIIKKLLSCPEIVCSINTDKDFLSIIISKNFVETKRLIDYVSSVYEGSKLEVLNPFYFPFGMSRIINLFDYNNFIEFLFNLNKNKKKRPGSEPNKNPKIKFVSRPEDLLF